MNNSKFFLKKPNNNIYNCVHFSPIHKHDKIAVLPHLTFCYKYFIKKNSILVNSIN